ncbi:hypothetical protein [Acinetobacter lwoffii]|uniref:hypothetical protein n=1 Tax=Acinetobacter lwoffii TaxID=28090 RepID=UPI0011DCAEB3|nr:hypothetical protein [Acinetobacter lwoffii]MDP1316737.1 hypothetical protein [Acinetobacter lwoffii]QXB85920.1 hypothetical protein I6L24_14355 [Acinetobacter lwoffii]
MQEQQTQTMVLQQPKDQKVYLDVQHSTDTTAIWSFIIAMVVAFILGISATVIAIWYGRKSFDLTKQSFDAVIAQIKGSEKSALDINKKLFEQQKELQKQELIYRRDFETEKRNKILIAEYFSQITIFILDGRNFQTNFMDEVESSIEAEKLYTRLEEHYKLAVQNLTLLELSLSNNYGIKRFFQITNLLTELAYEFMEEILLSMDWKLLPEFKKAEYLTKYFNQAAEILSQSELKEISEFQTLDVIYALSQISRKEIKFIFQ